MGALLFDVLGEAASPVLPGEAPILEARWQLNGTQKAALGTPGGLSLGVHAGARVRILPLFAEAQSTGAELVKRYSLMGALRPDNLLLLLEIGSGADLKAQGSFRYSLLSANTSLEAGADAIFVAARSYPRATPLAPMLEDLFRELRLPAHLTTPPAPGELLSFEFGGQLQFGVAAAAGYEIKGTGSVNVHELALAERYALAVVGKLNFTGRLAGRFSVDVTAGAEPGFAHIVVRRRRQKELQFAAGVDVTADLQTHGLPAGKEFLGAVLGVEAKSWLNLADSLVTQAGEVASTEALLKKLDGLAGDFFKTWAGPQLDNVQKRLAAIVRSYRTLDERAIALFDRYFKQTAELTAALGHLHTLTSFTALGAEADTLLWQVLRQLTDGDPLGWTTGAVPSSGAPNLPELQRRAASALALLQDGAHEEIRRFIGTAKEHFPLDALLDQLAAVTSPDALRQAAGTRAAHFAERLTGGALDKSFGIIQEVVQRRDQFFTTFDKVLKQAAAQSFSLGLHTAYNKASESHALLDLEIRLRDEAGQPHPEGIRLMAAAGRGDFEQVLARYQPGVVKLRHGLLTHTAARSSTLTFNVAGWHRSFRYEAMHRIITNTEQQIRDSGSGLLTVFTTVDMKAESAKRKRTSKGEETVLTNFLLRFLGETKVSDSTFNASDRSYLIEVITRMAARYDVSFVNSRTSPADLERYLEFARYLGLDRAGATPDGLGPVLEFKDGHYGPTSSAYEVRYTKEGLEGLARYPFTTAEVRQILRRTVFSNYFGHPQLGDVAWLYSSDDARRIYDSAPNTFAATESALNARLRLPSPIPGITRPRGNLTNTPMVRNAVAALFRIEDTILRAFQDLGALLRGTKPVGTADLETKLRSFTNALHAFDSWDMGENSLFAVFDGLVLLATPELRARASALTFLSAKDGAPHTKIFTHHAV